MNLDLRMLPALRLCNVHLTMFAYTFSFALELFTTVIRERKSAHSAPGSAGGVRRHHRDVGWANSGDRAHGSGLALRRLQGNALALSGRPSMQGETMAAKASRARPGSAAHARSPSACLPTMALGRRRTSC